jgi:hypothetical protein
MENSETHSPSLVLMPIDLIQTGAGSSGGRTIMGGRYMSLWRSDKRP